VVTSQLGTCDPKQHNINIYSLDDFDLGPFKPQEVCELGCETLNLNLPPSIAEDLGHVGLL